MDPRSAEGERRVSDFLVRRLPPMGNEWVLGLASGRALDASATASFRAALGAGDQDVVTAGLAVSVAGVEAANSNYFRFELESAVDDDEPRLVRLSPGTTTADLGLGLTQDRSTRKLVALVLLAVEGADVRLRLIGQDKHVEPEVGMLVMFPAFCAVEVESSSGGAVEAAAFHAFGPAFR